MIRKAGSGNAVGPGTAGGCWPGRAARPGRAVRPVAGGAAGGVCMAPHGAWPSGLLAYGPGGGGAGGTGVWGSGAIPAWAPGCGRCGGFLSRAAVSRESHSVSWENVSHDLGSRWCAHGACCRGLVSSGSHFVSLETSFRWMRRDGRVPVPVRRWGIPQPSRFVCHEILLRWMGRPGRPVLVQGVLPRLGGGGRAGGSVRSAAKQELERR
jgi:hypothetical protein